MALLKHLGLGFVFFLSIGMGASAGAEDTFRPFAQGLPLPWPFPWAKECPVEWERLQGRYLLSESEAGEHIDLKISIISRLGYELVRVSRFTQDGRMMSDGFTFVANGQKTISLDLIPMMRGEHDIRAIIRLHYVSNDYSCREEFLVPILTLERGRSSARTQTQYRLVRMLTRH